MSRVFLAHDASLGRDVVVKLLHPDLAGSVNAERFRREIQLAAQLQHPHIVPLLNAGEVNGVPFLTMPYVAGRSLRDRLHEVAILPLTETVDILRDVARALAFAHGRGVIHRDIKPDNVLLAEGSATVTDFGVAKAVSASRTAPAATLTGIGVSIGTPAYMAPEQAAGDPDVDHRADVYSWGAMAYEMLAGRPPFVDKSLHKLLAAHLGEAPEPILNHRPDCPEPLANLVMQSLAKNPEARPAGAPDLLRVLAEVTSSGGAHEARPAIALATRRTLVRSLFLYAVAFVVVVGASWLATTTIGLPEWVLPGAAVVMALGLPVVLFTAFVLHGARVARTMGIVAGSGSTSPESTMMRLALRTSTHVSWRRTVLGGVVAVTGFGVVVTGFMVTRALGIGPAGSLIARGALDKRDQIVVADFKAPATDSALGAVVADAVRMGLSESRAVRVIPLSQVASALQRMERASGSRFDRTTAREVAQREGAKAVVDGDVTPLGNGYVVTVRLLDATRDDELVSYRETAKTPSELVAAIDRAARKLRGRIGESLKEVRASIPLERATTSSLPALRKFTEGVRHNSIESNFEAAIAALEEAISLDTNFAIAYRATAIAYYNRGTRPGRADSLMERAFELRTRLPALERALVEGTYYASFQLDRRLAIAALRRALELDSTSTSAIITLGNALWLSGQLAAAESVYRLGLAARPDIHFMSGNLANILTGLGRPDEGLQILADFRKRSPDGELASRYAVAAWLAKGRLDSVAAICRRNAQSPNESTREGGALCLGVLAIGGGRLREFARVQAQVVALDAKRGGEFYGPISTIDSAWVDLWFRGRAAEAVARLDAFVARGPLSQYTREAFVPYLVSEAYAAAGQPDRARAALEQVEPPGPDTARYHWGHTALELALAEIAIAERRYDAAIAHLRSADTLHDGLATPCQGCNVFRIARAHDLAGRSDSAIASFESYLRLPPWAGVSMVERGFPAAAHKRLAELYDARSDRQNAASHYAAFIDLWKDADPELQPKVTAARERLLSLTRGERR